MSVTLNPGITRLPSSRNGGRALGWIGRAYIQARREFLQSFSFSGVSISGPIVGING